MDIGQAIRTLRLKLGMSQAQLAERCGTSANAVSAWETGKAWPPKGTVERVCQAFGIPSAYMQLAAIEEEDFPEAQRVLYRAMLEPMRNELMEKQERKEP